MLSRRSFGYALSLVTVPIRRQAGLVAALAKVSASHCSGPHFGLGIGKN